MIYEKNYKYSIIDEYVFNEKFLQCKIDGSKYRRYFLAFDKNGNSSEIPSEDYLQKLDNIVKVYDIEEITSSCANFDSMYDKLYYYHVNEKYFIKYTVEFEKEELISFNDDSEKIRLLFENV